MLYMQDWHICVPVDFSLGFEGDNNAVTLEISTDLPDGWDLKVDVAKDGEKNIIQLNRRDNVYYALLTSSMLADDGVYEMQVRGTLGDQVRHSNIFLSHVHNSINATDAFPPPLPSEFEQMEDRLTSINNNPPQPGENGYWLIWDPDDMEYKESDIPLPAEGGTVGTTDYNKLIMLWNIRILLEPNAAVMAMDNIPEKKVLELREMLQRVENDPSDFVRYMESDIAVHALFVDYLDNRYLKDILRNLKEHSMRMRWNVEQKRTAESVPVILESTKEHLAIIQAVEVRQCDALYDAVMKHLIDSKFRTMNISNEKHMEFETNGRKATLNFMHITKVKTDK